MDLEDVYPALLIRQTEFNLPVESSRSKQGRIQSVGPVGGHQHLDVSTGIEAIELQRFKLNFEGIPRQFIVLQSRQRPIFWAVHTTIGQKDY